MAYGVKDLRKCVVNHNRIIKLYQEGNAIIEISRLTGYTRNTIKAHLKKAGVYENPWDRKGNIYSREFNKHLGEENTEINLENRENRDCLPPALMTEYKKEFEKCQANREKNIGDIVVVEEDRQTETEEEEEAEQEVIEAANSINIHKGDSASDLAISNDQKQIAEIDKVINHCLKLLKDKDRLKRSKTSIINQVFSTMVEKKKLLQGLDPKNKDRNQFILNFISSREFVSELKKMKALKGDSM